LEKRPPGNRWCLLRLWTFRLGGTTQWLAEPERQDREDQAWHGGHVKGRAPAEGAGDDPAAGKAHGDPDRGARRPDRHGPAPAFFLEVVAEKRRAGRIVTCFPDPEHRSRNEELCVAPCHAGEERGQAPDRDADTDHRLAHAPVGPNAKWNRGDRIDQQEGATQQADLAVGQVELRLDPGGDGRQDVAIEVIQEVDADHDAEHVARVAAGHRGALCSAALVFSGLRGMS